MINSLLGAKVAKTSSTPGRTRSINFFEVRWPGKPRPELIFADLPGYGYSKVSREISEQWPSFIEPYLKERSCLALCMALVDINVVLPTSDRQLLDFLESSGRSLVIVATKSDRLSGNQLANAVRTMAQEHAGAHIVPYSARTGAGKEELWRHIKVETENYAARL